METNLIDEDKEDKGFLNIVLDHGKTEEEKVEEKEAPIIMAIAAPKKDGENLPVLALAAPKTDGGAE